MVPTLRHDVHDPTHHVQTHNPLLQSGVDPARVATPPKSPGNRRRPPSPEPAEGMPFFLDVLARGPRPVVVHEGLPGHWYQFSQARDSPESALHEVRRHWLDSTANEGVAFYWEQPLVLCS